MRRSARVLSLSLALLLSLPAGADTLMVAKTTDMLSAIDDISLAAANNGYQLVKVQPLDSALEKRGFDGQGLRILFIGKPDAVAEARAIEPRLLELLPLRLTLMQRGDEVVVMSDNLAPWKQEMAQGPGHALIEQWERELAAILADFRNQ